MFSLRSELHWGRVLSCYVERPPTVAAMVSASVAAEPTKTAVVDGLVRITYSQLGALSSQLADHLYMHGVRQSTRVAVMLDNGTDAVLTVLALAQLGAVLVPIGSRLRRPEISHIFGDAQPIAVIFQKNYGDELPSNDASSMIPFDTSSKTWSTFLETPAGSRAPQAEMQAEDLFAILYTSGTTGKPKGAMLTHLNVVHSCLHWQHALNLQSDERAVLCVPWSHVAGLCGVLLPFLHAGGTLVLMAEFKRRSFLQIAEREHMTYALMVPAMYGLCLLEPDLANFDLSQWRTAAYGSAPMPEPTIRRFSEAFPQLQMINCYGATETTSPATIMPRGEGLAHSNSIGKVVPCGDIIVMSDGGVELKPGEEGELWIGGPMVVPGYWRDPEATAASFAAGYWKSGDIGAIDCEGFVRIADRKKDMINRGGFKVYPAEVESVLAGIAGVIEAAVVGLNDSVLGETVVAFLNVSSDSLTADAVKAWCSTRMADYKVPARVEIAQRSLPRNANGKIQKAALRQLAEGIAQSGPRAHVA